MAALAREIEVERAERRREGVRVALRDRETVRIVDLHAVGERQLRTRDRPLVHAGGMDALQPHRAGALRPHAHGLGARPERSHDHAAFREVRAENRVRVVVVAHGDSLDVRACGHGTPAPSSRSMPATGIPTQSGRLSSS